MAKSNGRISPAKKKKIIADYLITQSYRETARKLGVSDYSVRKLVQDDPDTTRKLAEKAQENTQNAIEYLNNKQGKFVELIDLMVDGMIEKCKTPDMFTNIKDIATAFGIVVDKNFKFHEMQKSGVLDKAEDIEDDPLSAALREMAEQIDGD